MDIEIDRFPKNYDWLFLSGLFNDKYIGSEAFMFKIIRKMFKASRKGIVFNACLNTSNRSKLINMYFWF